MNIKKRKKLKNKVVGFKKSAGCSEKIDMANKCHGKIISSKDGKKRSKYLAILRDKKLYLLLGYKTFEDYANSELRSVFSPSHLQRYLDYDFICCVLGVGFKDFKEYTLRPMFQLKSNTVSIKNVWDFAQNAAKKRSLKVEDVEKGVFRFRLDEFLGEATSPQRRIIRNIMKLEGKELEGVVRLVSKMPK